MGKPLNVGKFLRRFSILIYRLLSCEFCRHKGNSFLSLWALLGQSVDLFAQEFTAKGWWRKVTQRKVQLLKRLIIKRESYSLVSARKRSTMAIWL